MRYLLGASLLGRLLASPTNNRQGRKGLPGPNTQAYYENPQIINVESFIVKNIVDHVIKNSRILCQHLSRLIMSIGMLVVS